MLIVQVLPVARCVKKRMRFILQTLSRTAWYADTVLHPRRPGSSVHVDLLGGRLDVARLAAGCLLDRMKGIRSSRVSRLNAAAKSLFD
ncbi:MAG: hypothetical protein JXA42_00560 [Anaerolineales bacterium]|nr:hypothetical protein [Anaerolineales bacterium]